MRISIRKGLGFGLTSGIITTLGLIIGLNSGTHSKLVIISGILVIAVADSFSDSLGIHISEEAGSKTTTRKQLWESTFSTFFFKLFFTLTFIVPVFLFELQTAVIISLIWAAILLTIFSYHLAVIHNTSKTQSIVKHLAIATVVVILTNFIGDWAAGLGA